jgi:hypothetical protein
VYMLHYLLGCWLLLAQNVERASNPNYGVSIQPAPGWASLPVNADEPEVIFRFGKDSSLMVVRVYKSEQGFTESWNALRYAAVLDLNGQILKDEAILVEGKPGRMLVYRAEGSSGKDRTFLRVNVKVKDQLYLFHSAFDPQRFTTERDEVQRMIQSFDFN